MPTPDRTPFASSAVGGSLNATGGSVEEIILGARAQIARVAGRRTFGIKRVELRPLVVTDGGGVQVWDADVDFEVFDAAD